MPQPLHFHAFAGRRSVCRGFGFGDMVAERSFWVVKVRGSMGSLGYREELLGRSKRRSRYLRTMSTAMSREIFALHQQDIVEQDT